LSLAVQCLAGAARAAGSVLAASAPAVTTSLLLAAAERVSRRPDLLRDRLAAVRSCPVLLEKISQRSYWHSNGFAKIKLAETRRLCLRLHVWPSGRPRFGDVNPHGHRWEFASWIAIGRGLVERYFENAAADQIGAQCYLRCDYGPAHSGLRARNLAWLRESGFRELPVGRIYPCERNVVHTVSPIGDGLIATVVVQGPVLADSAMVFLGPNRKSDEVPKPIPLSDLGDLLAAVGAGLPRESGAGVVGATPVGTVYV
jgi:hypothetical protein